MDLSLIKKYIPDFEIINFSMFSNVIEIRWVVEWDFDMPEKQENLYMTMQSEDGYEIDLKFEKVPGAEAFLNRQISGFEIKDMGKYGYDPSVRYEIRDYEDGRISFNCRDVVIKDVRFWKKV
ncbi:MAG: hypothetical protein IJA01_06570 [Firmicutes bacterium]|nr:hypothetical protein [Bacillota bacterium]